jgi:4-amino-4-deoxy-L-arabinose transferase-like glycosyltransferase
MGEPSQIEDAPELALATNKAKVVGTDTGRVSKNYKPNLPVLFLAISLVVAALLYFAVMTRTRFGAYHDDGIYVTTAKALAQGEGYRIISLPYEPAQTKYPPLYPFLLSLIWRAYPEFPQNLTPMTLLSVIATIGFLAITLRYLLEREYVHRWQALVVIAMTALNWRTMILATSIYSEMLFAMLSVAGLYMAEKYEKEAMSWLSGIALGALIGLAFLTRSSGLALLIAVGLHFAVRRRWRQTLLPVGVGSLFVLGWAAWSYFNRTTFEGGNSAYYTSYVRDIGAILDNLADQSNGSRLAALLTIAGENLVGSVMVSIPIVCLGLSYDSAASLGGVSLGLSLGFILVVFLMIAAGFMRHSRKGFRLLHTYVLVYLGLHLLWPYASYDRFLMCVAPFLLVFFIAELEMPVALIRGEASSSGKAGAKVSAAFLSLMLLLASSLLLYTYASGIVRTLGSLKAVAEHDAEDSYLIQWINANTAAEDVLICYRDPKYYLYTGRKAISFSWPKRGSSWEGQQSLLLRIVNESRGRYLILTSTDFNHDYDEQLQRQSLRTLVDANREVFTPVFTPDASGIVYRIERTE